ERAGKQYDAREEEGGGETRALGSDLHEGGAGERRHGVHEAVHRARPDQLLSPRIGDAMRRERAEGDGDEPAQRRDRHPVAARPELHQPQTWGRRPFQGASFSSWAASRKSVASSAYLAVNIIPIGRPPASTSSGRLI